MNKRDLADMLDRFEEAKAYLKSREYNEFRESIDEVCDFFKKFDSITEVVRHVRDMERRVYVVKEYLTIDEVAQYLQVSKATVYKITSNKEVTYFKPNGKTIFIRREELERWIGKNAYLSNSELERQANLLAYQLEKDRKGGGK